MPIKRKTKCDCRLCSTQNKSARSHGKNKDWLTDCRRLFDGRTRTAALVGGGILLFAGKLVRWICGSPWGSLAALSLGDALPSFFWMGLLWSIWYFVLGAIFGALMLGERRDGVISLRAMEKYRAGMYFVAMILLGFLWYPLFFVAARFALAALICIGVTVLAVFAAISYWRVLHIAGVVVMLHAIFLGVLSCYHIWIVFRG